MLQFTVPDFYEKGQFNLDWVGFMKLYPEKFQQVKIQYVYGSFPTMVWAGGRQNKVDHINFVPLDDVETIINRFNYLGIGVVFTFTNSLIVGSHLGDWYCNACLDILGRNAINAVLVNSMVLEEYIREKCPWMKIFRSTTASRAEVEDSAEDLEDENYDMIVADYRLNNTTMMYTSKEQRERVEIMLNDTCPPYCQYRKDHYSYISQYNLQGGKSRINPTQGWECHHPECKTSFFENLRTNASCVTVGQMWDYFRQGFTHFKIVGREFNPIQLAEIYTYYMVKPEYQAEVMSWAIYRFSNIIGG